MVNNAINQSTTNIEQCKVWSGFISPRKIATCGKSFFFFFFALGRLLVLAVVVNHLAMTNQAHDCLYWLLSMQWKCQSKKKKNKKKDLEKDSVHL